MKKYDIYVFDLDGTLLNTLYDLAASCNYALRQFGMMERSIEDVRRFVGNGVRKLIERAVPAGTSSERVDEVLDAFKQHYMEHGLDTTKPYDGILPMLERLKADGRRVAVVSNKFDVATRELCRRFFAGLVDVSVGEREGLRRKPAPDTVLEALRMLGVSELADDVLLLTSDAESSAASQSIYSQNEFKRRVVYVGDSDVDIATARACGVDCISVTWGFRDLNFLLTHGGNMFAGRPEEIY